MKYLLRVAMVLVPSAILASLIALIFPASRSGKSQVRVKGKLDDLIDVLESPIIQTLAYWVMEITVVSLAVVVVIGKYRESKSRCADDQSRESK